MEIGNIQSRNRRPLTNEEKFQRQNDKQNSACFVWHKQNCRPWKFKSNINSTEITNYSNNVKEEEQLLSDSDSKDSEN